MIDDVINFSFFGKPSVKGFMSHTYAKGIYAKKLIRVSMICNSDAFGVIIMLPMKMKLFVLLVSFTEHPSVCLVFDIQKFCRIKPVTWIVLNTVNFSNLNLR